MWLEAVRLQPPEEAKKVNEDKFFLFYFVTFRNMYNVQLYTMYIVH